MMSASVCTTDDGDCKSNEQQPWVLGSATAAVFVGAIIGQLSMGYLGDVIGRGAALLVTMSIACISSMLSAVASQGSAASIYAVIICFRFTLGIGLGGTFPLSAAKAAENSKVSRSSSSTRVDSAKSSWTFFWQSPGLLGPWLLAYILTFNSSISTSAKWRLVLGLGTLPSFFAILGLLFEMYIDRLLLELNTDKYAGSSSIKEDPLRESQTEMATRSSHSNDVSSSSASSEKPADFASILSAIKEPQNLRNLWACGGSWFLYDVVSYGLSLISGEIIDALKSTDDDNESSNDNLQYICSHNLIAYSLSIPATIITIWLLPKWGLKWLQVIGSQVVCIDIYYSVP
jgi:PHS family inorganic phosphate transporter-like MFS transporter